MLTLFRPSLPKARIIKLAATVLFAVCVYWHPFRARLIPTNFFCFLMIVGMYGAALGTMLFRWRPGQPLKLNPLQLQTGLSTLGAVSGIVVVLSLFLWCVGAPVLPILDLLALYLPLLQSVVRIGCFYAGCCAGRIPFLQLYSSAGLFIIFLLLRFGLSSLITVHGALCASYLMLTSAERFILDFWRVPVSGNVFRVHRVLAMLLFIGSALFLFNLLLAAT